MPPAEAKLTWSQVLRWRVGRQFLDAEKGKNEVDIARRLCGVHAQVASSSATALRLRAPSVTQKSIASALETKRTLVKVWSARGTLHLLPAADLPIWVAAMSTRQRETKPSWLKANGVTAKEFAALMDAIPSALGDEALTREELADRILTITHDKHLRDALTQGWGSMLKPAAFNGELVFGPNRGRYVTFVSPRSWLKTPRKPPDTDDAIDALVRAHVDCYGPSSPEEFSRWFDLSPRLSKASYARLGDDLAPVDVEGTHLFIAREHLQRVAKPPKRRVIRLLAGFDPYVVGSLRQLDRVAPPKHRADISRTAGWISSTVCVDGRIVGTWEGTTKGDRLAVSVTPFEPLPRPMQTAVRHAARDFALAQEVSTAEVAFSSKKG